MVFNRISSTHELEQYLTTKGLGWEECRLPSKQTITSTFPLRIPLFYANLIDWSDPYDPLRLMVVPDEREKTVKDYELTDPIGDHAHEPVSGLIHRYPDRCLLLLTSFCGVHCRFCFRRDTVGKVLPVDIAGIKKYLSRHIEIREVIFSGGDPATFPPGFFRSVMKMLTAVAHLRTYRVHSRALVVDPGIFSEKWLEAFVAAGRNQCVVVLHINHPRELTKELVAVVLRLKQKGVMVLSQTVLLKGINDNEETLKEMFTKLIDAGVKPYYLHHLDKARGTHHFRISIARGIQLFGNLRGKISGYALPEYVIDLPGGEGKVPVMWLQDLGSGVYQAKNFEGKKILYHDEGNHL